MNVAASQVGKAGKKGPSMVYGIALGLTAGFMRKSHHWSNKRKTKEFYDLLDKGLISVVEDPHD